MVMMVVVVVVLVAVVAMMAMVAVVVIVAVAIVANTSYDWSTAAAMNVDVRVASRARLVLLMMVGRTVFVVFALDRNRISAWQAAWRTDVRRSGHLAAARGRRGASYSARRACVVEPAREWIQKVESASSGARSGVEKRREAARATWARRRKRRLNIGCAAS